MADIKQAFGSSTAITITLASLANGSARQSAAIDNSTDKFLDVLVQLSIKLATGTPSAGQNINIYVYGSEDGTKYTDNATGANAAITLRNPTNLKEAGSANPIQTPDSGGLTYTSEPFSIASLFGGVMPRKWGVVVSNDTGLAFASGEGNHTKKYTGIYATVV